MSLPVRADLKVAVVGCGALGSFYGAKLSRLGCPTHFLLRSDYQAVRRHGVRIRSDQGDLHVRPHCALRPSEIGPADLVLIGLKTTANDQFPILLPPLVGPQTLLLTLQNGLGNEEALAQLFPAGQILGGLCFVCLNRLHPGVVHHLAHGNVVLGEFNRPSKPRTHEVAELFARAGVPCKVTEDLARAHWEKLVWNIPFNGLGVASAAGRAPMEGRPLPDTPPGPCLTTEQLLADPWWAALVHDLMREVIDAARALGFSVDDNLAGRMLEKTRRMGAYKASTVFDFELGRPLELEALFRTPLARAGAKGVGMPILRRLCEVLDALDRRRHGMTHPSPRRGVGDTEHRQDQD